MGNLRVDPDHGNSKTGKRKRQATSEDERPGKLPCSTDRKDGHDSTTKITPEDNGGSPGPSTPSSVKHSRPNPPSPSPSPSSNNNSSQTASNTSRFRISDSTATGATITLNPSSNHENSYSWKEDASHDEILDLIAARRLFESPKTKEVFESHKSHLQPTLVGRLKELSGMEPAYKVGLQMADSVYLLKLLSSPNHELETSCWQES